MKIANARQGRRFWVFAVGALVALALVWTGVWFLAARALSHNLRLAQTESTVSRLCGVKEIGGYPFRLRLRCAGFAAPLHVASAEIIAKADEASGEASVFAPNHIVLTLTSPLSLVRANGTALANLHYDNLSVDLHWSGRQLADALAIARGVSWSAEAPAALFPFKLQLLEAHLKPSVTDAGAGLHFDVTGDGLQIPVLSALIHTDTPGQLRASGDVRPLIASESEMAQGWRAAAESWRTRQGAINFESVEFVNGPLNIRVNGPLSLDEAHRLSGRLNLQTSGAGPVLTRLGLPPQLSQVQGILGALLGAPPPKANGDTLALTVTLGQGRIFLGPLRLPWALAPLY